MRMVEKKQYSDEFKREALDLQETSGKRVAEVEREWWLSHGLLRQWKAWFRVNDETDTLELNEVEQLPDANVTRTPFSQIQLIQWSPTCWIASSQPIAPIKSG